MDKVDNKGVQLGFAALQVKERQVSRRMEREEEEVDRDTAILQQKKVVASLLKDFSSLT